MLITGITDRELVHKLYDIHLYLFVTSINVFCALGLCSRVLLLKILQTKRLKTHKKTFTKKRNKQKTRDVIYRIIRRFNSFIMETSGHADNW